MTKERSGVAACGFGVGRVYGLMLVIALLMTWAGHAAALDPEDVPAPLKPWLPWVLEKEGDELCPRINKQPVCVWPRELELQLDESGGRFRLSLQVDASATVALPGGDKQWPQDVAVDFAPAIVLAAADVPTVQLARGSHEVTGRFVWPRLPETLALPDQLALLQLSLLGQRVALPKRDSGRVWLKGSRASVDEPESLTLEVFRKLEDQVPFRVRTQLVLQVSGKSRELRLPSVLLEGALPIELMAKLPARLEASGQLLLQVYPGRHEIEIDALYGTPPERLVALPHAPPWPNHEVWVFAPATEYRQSQISGGLGIDPQRTNLPAAWRDLAAYQLPGGTELTIQSLRRGQPNPPPNRLSLERELWLDLDAQGYTVRDKITGTMSRTWRLDLGRGELGHVTVAGTDQLITTHPESGVPGIELRRHEVDMSAEWRLTEASQELPAVAWSENMEQLSTVLYLPPGWQLLSVSGADSVSDSWLSRWDLFALFFVLVVAIAIAKLDRPVWGVVALLALVLGHGEMHAPQFIWGAVLLGIALLKGLPMGRFRGAIRALTVICGLILLGWTLSFAVSQIRAALHPQVRDGQGMFALDAPFEARREAVALGKYKAGPASPSAGGRLEQQESAASLPDPDKALEPESDDYLSSKRKTAYLAQDPKAMIQTGPGVPSWRWQQWHLGWSGPVEHTHTLRLHLISPAVAAVLSALRILLMSWLTFWALRQIVALTRRRPPGPLGPELGLGAKLPPLGALLFSLLLASPAAAQLPSPELLLELERRVQAPGACEGACLEVPRLELRIAANTVLAVAEVHAGARVAYKLPGPAARWVPSLVEVDDRPAKAMLLGADGSIYLRLEPGRHRVRMQGPIAGRELNLEPGTAPRSVRLEAQGWEVTGLSEGGQIEGSLQLVRPLPETPGVAPERDRAADDGASALASWSLVVRTFIFGVNWSAETEIRRIGPKGSLLVVKVPLAPGERVTSANLPTEGPFAIVRLMADTESVRFDSVLEARPELKLAAPKAALYSERWNLRCGPVFRCDLRGIAPIQHDTDGRWEPTFAPWPGEELSIGVTRPAAAVGQTATVDAVTLDLHPGVRLLRAELSAKVRVSTQTAYQLALPAGSEVDQLSIGGKNEPIRQDGTQLELVFPPGEHDLSVSWQEPGGFGTLFSTPTVRLGGALTNTRINVHLPDERWLLLAGGPKWGPAILFWSHMVLILLLAPVLGRLPRSPLRSWQWALLSLGLTQVPLPIAGLVFGWFFVMAWHDVELPQRPLWFNLRQFALLLLTLVFLGCLFGAVYDSLLNTPDMEVAGADSHNRMLGWYVDRTGGELPKAWVISTSLWVWRGVMLVWALWLAWNLVGWLKWAWSTVSRFGVWKPWRKASA